MDIETAKSYATKENLLKAIEKNGWKDHRYLIVRIPGSCRLTAIFPQSNIQDGNMCRYAYHGFVTLG